MTSMLGCNRRRHATPKSRPRRQSLQKLNDRERRVFEARRLRDEPLTLEELSQEFSVSRERIRQIEVRAFEKIQKAVRNAAQAAMGPRAAEAG